MTDDTARRERAEKSLSTGVWGGGEEHRWARSVTADYRDDDDNVGSPVARGFLYGYLAGSREEAAIKDAEIGRLESLLDRARPLARKNLEQAAEIEELKAEIATLREAVREAYETMESCGHDNWCDWSVVRRALEETP